MAKKTVAFVVYPGISLLELAGNRSVLDPIMGLGPRMKLKAGYVSVVVGERLEAIPTDTPMPIIPQKTFADVPQPEGLVVIGGGTDTLPALEHAELVDYVRRAGEKAEWVAATSTGALLLAAAGLLEGRSATTHWAYADRLEAYGVHYQPAASTNWVTDGKFTTAAGVSGAIDMAIGLGAHLTNQATAQLAQLQIEYDPHPPFGRLDWTTFERDRATLARLVSQHMAEQRPAHEIAFVLYPGLTVFDLVGPLEVFSALRRIAPQFCPVVVAEQAGPVTSDNGVRVVPNGTFDDLPHPYAFFVPGGGVPTLNAMSNLAIRRYIRTAAQDAKWIVSVCTGALLLASVGLLEGCEVTTHWAYTRYLEHLGAHYVQKRWTVNGNIVNAAGVSAGIDMALYMVSRLTDEETARRVQWLIHYDPQPPFGGIDYKHMKLLLQLYRGISSLIAPFYTAKARRDILAPIQEKPCIYSATSFSGSTGNQKALGMWVSDLDFLGALQGWNRAARTYQSAKGRRQETVSQRQPGPEPTQVPANSHAYLIRCRCEIHSRASCDFSVVTRAENTPRKIYGEHTSQGKPDG